MRIIRKKMKCLFRNNSLKNKILKTEIEAIQFNST